jgi:YhcH/YjgK/YiaL family protein
MAIFGNLEVLKNQVDRDKFKIAFDYLEKVNRKDSKEYNRLLSLNIDSFEKIELEDNNFALEQVYFTRERQNCFFESHKKYIDIQFILEGEELIEVSDVSFLKPISEYDDKADLIKYETKNDNSIIRLRKGDVAIFYPQDAHMPCIMTKKKMKVIKTVVKVPI